MGRVSMDLSLVFLRPLPLLWSHWSPEATPRLHPRKVVHRVQPALSPPAFSFTRDNSYMVAKAT